MIVTRREEQEVKHQRVVEYMESHSLDAVVLAQRPNFAWYTVGGLNHVGTADSTGIAALLITRDRAICITNNIEAPRLADEELADLDIEVKAAPWFNEAAMQALWSAEIAGLRTACDVSLPALPGEVWRLGTDFAALRWVMTEGEIRRYRILAREVAECLELACGQAKPGMTEFDLAARIAQAAFAKGIRTPVLLVAADDRTRRYRHPIPTGRLFERHGMGVLGGERHGLTVSLSRLFSFGAVDSDLRHRHEAVCQVDAAMIAATRPGKAMGEVLALAQEVYAQQGFTDEWTFHHQGGLTGYLGREVRVGPGCSLPIQTNQIFAWNPSIGGTKSEDTILVGADRNEILSLTGAWPSMTFAIQGQQYLRCCIREL
ncbi:MAG: M24 family metallopeptidase [Phycisphaerae bacterium]